MFALQLSEQAGPAIGSLARDCHESLTCINFATALLDKLQSSLKRVQRNWESYRAIWTFTMFAARLLTLGPVELRRPCLDYLANCRDTCLGWLTTLQDKVASASNSAVRTDFMKRCLQIALVCLSSFDVERKFLYGILAESGGDFLRCLIRAWETKSGAQSEDIMLEILMLRSKRLALRALPILAENLSENRLRFDQALGHDWQSDQPWELEDKCWASNKAQAGRGAKVHLNLLTGELIMNGHPLSRLPSEYESHPDYKLFGSRRLEILPCSEPGMQFSARSKVDGHQVCLGLSQSSLEDNKRDLLMRATNDQAVYDLIPSRVFVGRVPSSFAHDFVHFFDAENRSVEFRPAKDPWKSRVSDWKLKQQGGSWRISRCDEEALVDPASPTASNVVAVFRPLEEQAHVHVSYHALRKRVFVQIPRLKLGFHVEMGSTLVQSRQFKGMCVSESQDVGNLIGLRNKLLLSEKGGPLPQMILIPEGTVSLHEPFIGEEISHVVVEVRAAKRIQSYRLDNHLRRLVGSSLQSKLYLAHLHALTSFVLPDPLTGLSGTEQALKILEGGDVSSFRTLDSENIDTLGKIANLTPKRHLISKSGAQVTNWQSDGLGPFSQSTGLYNAVKELFDQMIKTRFLYPQSNVKIPDLHVGDLSLLRRNAIRSSSFFTSSFGAEAFTTEDDEFYDFREHNQARADAALHACLVMAEGKGRIMCKHEQSNQATSLIRKTLMGSGSAITRGPVAPVLPGSEFVFDARWLEDPSRILPEALLRIHKAFATLGSKMNRFDIMIWMATIAFAEHADLTVTQTLLGIVSVKAVTNIPIPDYPFFNLSHGLKPKVSELRKALLSACVDFEASDEASLPAHPGETRAEARRRRKEAHQEGRKEAIEKFAERVIATWTSRPMSIHKGAQYIRYFDFNEASKRLLEIFELCQQNKAMDDYLRKIAKTLKDTQISDVTLPSERNIRRPYYEERRVLRFLTVAEVLENVPTMEVHDSEPVALAELLLVPTHTATSPQVSTLLNKLSARAVTELQSCYVNELKQSFSSLGNNMQDYKLVKAETNLRPLLESHLLSCIERFRQLWRQLECLAGPRPLESRSSGLTSIDLASLSHSWPRITIRSVLEQLNQRNRGKLSEMAKRRIVMLAVGLTELQQAERLLRMENSDGDLIKEIRNQKPRSWSPARHPDYLLLEIECDLRIRPVQEQIAAIMQDPPDGQNAVLQLSMGQGKTAVIVPMAAASIADGSRLARVLVAKPQLGQMHDILVSRLGGLLGRRVWQLPFARTTKIEKQEADVIAKLCTECKAEGGVLLVQPEHLLSLQLKAILKSIESNQKSPDLGQTLLNTLTFFDNHSQDLIDECDESFTPKLELIYTKGKQGPISFSPYRWLLIHEVLSLVAKFATQVQREMPLAIEIDDHGDRFPRVRLLSEEAGAKLSSLIAAHVCRVDLNSELAMGRQSHSMKDAILHYITDKDVDSSVIDKVQGIFVTESKKCALLLLRGLLAGGVLAFALASKRWTVDFGLDRDRQPSTRLAVPYSAKNVPSSASEFSHPDLQIILTSLCYYYNGLGEGDLISSLKHVAQSDHAKSEYATWVAGRSSVPESFRNLDGLNLGDEACTREAFAFLRYSKGAIDYFLSRIVFPKEIREFPSRLSASGWDIGRIKAHPTTGFSGTKDTSYLLPLEMRQIQAPNQEHTNAMVLRNMLAEGNTVILLSEMGHAGPCVGKQLIETIAGLEPHVKVILDIGAQVLEMSNQQIAQFWLKLTGNHDDTEAALFSDEDGEFVVIDRDGHVESLRTSPFGKQLDRCLVFVDQARCFGTDLQLPVSSRAAVTLGARTTKDKLAQACMRMRKLGAGQTVVFCVPQEIEMRIRSGQPGLASGPLAIDDIIDWTISETWLDCERSIGMWAVQGTRFEKQRILWDQGRDDEELRLRVDLAEKFLEDEAQTLESLYQPDYAEPPRISDLPIDPGNSGRILERCKRFQHTQYEAGSLQETKEREVALELEKEFRIERMEDATPAEHRLNAKVREFIESGELSASNTGFLWAFQALENTTAAAHFDVRRFPRQLRCTHDFASTLKDGAPPDAFQRGVQFVLTRFNAEKTEKCIMVLISPYEAEKLYSSIQASERVLLRLYAPRQNQSYESVNLQLFHFGKAPSNHPIPRDLMIQLNLFAGQLYFDSYQEYVDVCNYLCLSYGDPEDGDGAAIDGFVEPSRRVRPHYGRTNFAESPVQFLKVLMAIRGGGSTNIEKTHVGRMLNGVILTEDDFEPRPKRKAERQLTREEDEAESSLFMSEASGTEVKSGGNTR